MKNSAVVTFGLVLLFPLALAAQSPADEKKSPEPVPPQLSETDRDWLDAAMLARPLPSGQPNSIGRADPEAAALARQQAATRFRTAADKAKAFREKYPDSAKAPEARQLEAKALLNAAMAGDNSQEARTSALIADVQIDKQLPAKLRLETVALSEIVRLRPLARDREQFLAAHEQSARKLITLFGGEPGAYENFQRVAASHPDAAKSRELLEELLKMPAPEAVKASARGQLERYDLVGKSFADVLAPAIGEKSALSGKQRTVLYTWATWSKGSITFAKTLARSIPAGSVLVGVNLDTDVEAAKALAAAESLPGEQVYDARGLESPVAQALKLNSAPQVYASDSAGIIRDTAVQRGNLANRLAAIRQ